ncbi:hypothetical protein A2W14_02910 [Candidatus Gottesmanbacteria bacterium RBG_16_37_8]|uniref:Helix-turn-helix domain-containing protein n=1 Tax=Candidatus Gottesmanbacteria bacterium RBG_16_37_8 TaxID=1798371 RepID=A0A1F5YTB2_9BACT|nr:MAG: hypothetical protein A2W14_02910 [Candidatus Gottesmanbacteria bacterium RBG_16_37_8]
MREIMYSPIAINELTTVIKNSVAECFADMPKYKDLPVGNKKIFGVKGLKEFLKCSEPTAIKIARSGKFPRYQEGRKIFFYESEVLKGLSR